MPISPITPVGVGLPPVQASRVLGGFAANLQQSMSRIASGLRLTSPEIDPAGLAQSIQLESTVSRVGAAESNLANSLSFLETQAGGLDQIHTALNRMGELGVRAQDVTLSESDRSNLQQEFSQLQEIVSKVASQQFNGVDLFSSGNLEVTADSDAKTVSLHGVDVSAPGSVGGLGDVLTGINVKTPEGSALALERIRTATDNLASMQATVGANQQRVSVGAEGLSVMAINLSNANGRIANPDIALESTALARNQQLVNTALMIFVQANRFPRQGISALA